MGKGFMYATSKLKLWHDLDINRSFLALLALLWEWDLLPNFQLTKFNHSMNSNGGTLYLISTQDLACQLSLLASYGQGFLWVDLEVFFKNFHNTITLRGQGSH